MEQDQPLSPGRLPDADDEVRRLLIAGRLPEANALLDKVLGTNEAVADQTVRASLLVHRAVMAWSLGRIPLALELAAEGWTDFDAAKASGAAAAHTLGQLGYLLGALGNRRAALDTLRMSVRCARESGDPVVLATNLQRLGGTLNFDAADGLDDNPLAAFEEARTVLAEGLGLGAEARTHRGLLGAYGRSLAGLGELAAAAEAGRQVLRLGIAADDLWSIGVGQWVLAIVHQERGELVEARTLAARAVVNAEEIADSALLLRFSTDLADICAALDDPVGEAAALRRSTTAARKAADTLRDGLGQAMEQRRLAAVAQRMAMAAQEAAARDPLTGLANRLGLERAAPAMLARAVDDGRTPWLVLVDIDWFKGVNDDAGHAAGDAALRSIAQLIRHECRSDDLVARWAGDEFVVLLGDASGERDAGPVVAERIRASVAEHDWTMMLGAARRPTVSIGVASGPAGLDDLFAAADLVLYQAKRQGRNRVAIYQHEPQMAAEG
ncbi:MAG TPA: GGDEF domain-containing protein [Pseudonocardiaceae bacterium]|nr:GGDEF domain-containing protein [Pseudonocardiaceae bacterium]